MCVIDMVVGALVQPAVLKRRSEMALKEAPIRHEITWPG